VPFANQQEGNCGKGRPFQRLRGNRDRWAVEREEPKEQSPLLVYVNPGGGACGKGKTNQTKRAGRDPFFVWGDVTWGGGS